MKLEALVKLAAEAYVYGYPMVYTIEEQIKHAGGGHPSTGPARPVNVMGHTDILLGPEAEFVSLNSGISTKEQSTRTQATNLAKEKETKT